jgi:hypothetical protein
MRLTLNPVDLKVTNVPLNQRYQRHTIKPFKVTLQTPPDQIPTHIFLWELDEVLISMEDCIRVAKHEHRDRVLEILNQIHSFITKMCESILHGKLLFNEQRWRLVSDQVLPKNNQFRISKLPYLGETANWKIDFIDGLWETVCEIYLNPERAIFPLAFQEMKRLTSELDKLCDGWFTLTRNMLTKINQRYVLVLLFLIFFY